MEAGIRPASTKDDGGLPSHLQSVVHRHLVALNGPPTPETVAAICSEVVSPSHKEDVVYYFLIQSPLRVRDLTSACTGIGANQLVRLCRNATRNRERLLSEGWKPRWEGAKTS